MNSKYLEFYQFYQSKVVIAYFNYSHGLECPTVVLRTITITNKNSDNVNLELQNIPGGENCYLLLCVVGLWTLIFLTTLLNEGYLKFSSGSENRTSNK